MIRAAFLIFMAHGGGTVLSFLRNILIGRVVSVEDFGVVSTFALAFSIIQAVTYAGFDRMLVQAPDGDQEEFQANLQFLQMFRGLTGAFFFLLFAWPYAWFLDNLDIYRAYLIMSLVPLMRGFIHFDIYRVQREMNFVPTALVTTGAPLVSLVATAVLLLIVQDYRVIIGAILAQQAVYVALSHYLAKRPWRVSWNREVTIRALYFGIPLFLNGLLVFAIHNGDMMLVGGFFDMETLGWFYVATLLTVTPALHLDTTVRSITLPGLSRAQSEPTLFIRRATETIEISTAAAILLLGSIYLFGPAMVMLLFGERYDAALPYMLPLAVLYAIKTLKAGPNTIALAMAKTRIPIYTNLPRGLSLLISALVLSQGGGLPTVVAIAIGGEIACVGIAYMLAVRQGETSLSATAGLRSLAVFAAALALTTADAILYPASAETLLPWTRIPVAILGLAIMATLPGLRRFVTARLQERFRKERS